LTQPRKGTTVLTWRWQCGDFRRGSDISYGSSTIAISASPISPKLLLDHQEQLSRRLATRAVSCGSSWETMMTEFDPLDKDLRQNGADWANRLSDPPSLELILEAAATSRRHAVAPTRRWLPAIGIVAAVAAILVLVVVPRADHGPTRQNPPGTAVSPVGTWQLKVKRPAGDCRHGRVFCRRHLHYCAAQLRIH